MRKVKKHKKILIWTLCAAVAVSIFAGIKIKASAVENRPKLDIEVSSDRSNYLVNEDMKVKYTVTPEPLRLNEVNDIQQKEIILVINSSIEKYFDSTFETQKEIAADFIDQFKDRDDIKISVVNYTDKVKECTAFKKANVASEREELKNFIKGIKPETYLIMGNIFGIDGSKNNIGDAMRRSIGMFSDNAKKYVLMMSNINPNYYTRIRNGGTSFNPKYEHYMGTDINPNVEYRQNADEALSYGLELSSVIKKNNISSYFIGVKGSISDWFHDNTSSMTKLADAAGGSTYNGNDEENLKKIYSDISDQIKAAYVVDNIKFNFSLPSNMSYIGDSVGVTQNGNSYSMEIDNIKYGLSADGTKYIADPFDITLELNASKKGNYVLGDGWNITYKGTDGSDKSTDIPETTVSVSTFNLGFDLSRNFKDGNNRVLPGSTAVIEYKIQPQNISVTQDIAGRVNADNILTNAKVTETLPQGLRFIETGNRENTRDISFSYNYNADTGEFSADPVTCTFQVIVDSPGTYNLNNAKFTYDDFEGISVTMNFNALTLKAGEDYILKEGFFEKCDNYCYRPNGTPSILKDTLIKNAAYIRTNDDDVVLNLQINELDSSNIASFSDYSAAVYKITDGNDLQLIKNVDIGAWKSQGNMLTASIPIEGGNSGNLSYYVVNYNFKPVYSDVSSQNNSAIICTAKLNDKTDEFKISIKGNKSDIPDLK